MQTVKDIKEWLSVFPDNAIVSFHTSDRSDLLLLSVYPKEDVNDNEASHVCVDIGEEGE